MANRGGDSVKPAERSYQIIEKIGAIEGQIDVLTHNIQALSDNQTTVIMSAKNTLKFSGRVDEDVDDLIVQLKILKIANNWTDDQLYGQTLVTLKDDAFGWFQTCNENDFLADNKRNFKLLTTALKKDSKRMKQREMCFIRFLNLSRSADKA